MFSGYKLKNSPKQRERVGVNMELNITSLEQLGGWLCLDFANTADWNGSNCLEDFLGDYIDLVTWSQKAEVLPLDIAERLRKKATEEPDAATATFDRALSLRDVIHRLFGAIAHEQQPQTSDLMALNAELAIATPHLQIMTGSNGFGWQWGQDEELDRMLWPIVWSAAQLLNDGDRLKRVRQCPADDCGWLFLDMSRNRSRRWCDMKDCGNRAKANRHYRRKQGVLPSDRLL